jgi:hypothetical protein
MGSLSFFRMLTLMKHAYSVRLKSSKQAIMAANMNCSIRAATCKVMSKYFQPLIQLQALVCAKHLNIMVSVKERLSFRRRVKAVITDKNVMRISAHSVGKARSLPYSGPPEPRAQKPGKKLFALLIGG